MCSEPTRRRSAAALVAVLVLTLAACGKQGDPRPRPRNVPQPANDLALRLRGDTLLVSFAYPAATVAGLPLDGLDAATVYEIVQPLAATAPLPRLAAADFDAVARPALELAGAELDAAIAGDRIQASLRLPAAALGAEEVRAYAVRTTARAGEASPWSNVVVLRAAAAPEAPADLRTTPTKPGVELRWTPTPGSLGSVVLRREASEPRWGAPLATLPAGADAHLDRAALYGTRYVYTVLALGAENPPVESAPRAEREVDYRDVFAPEPPSGLRVLVAAGEVRLVWDASPDGDVAGYLVERRAGDGPFERLPSAPVVGLETADRAAPAGVALAYRVLAIDRAGNASPPTEAVEVPGR